MSETARPAPAAPTVSVVLPTHNRAGLLRRAIDSVLGQTYTDLELIVVDDASTDDTEQLVDGLNDPRLHYLSHHVKRGAPAARNTGIEAARGTYVAFQDSDDVWQPDKLAKQMAAIDRANGAAEIIYCGMLRRGGGEDRYIPDPKAVDRDGDTLHQLLFANFVGTPTLVVLRSLLREVGGFNVQLGRFQDWDLAIRLAAVARFRLVDEPLVIVHDTPGSISADDVAGAAALQTMVNTHRSLYERYPLAMASALAGMGHLQCLSGDLAGGRRHFRQALRITPYSPKFWAALLLSLLGARAYRRVHVGRSRARSPARDRAPA